jgi:hypothetical protein
VPHVHDWSPSVILPTHNDRAIFLSFAFQGNRDQRTETVIGKYSIFERYEVTLRLTHNVIVCDVISSFVITGTSRRSDGTVAFGNGLMFGPLMLFFRFITARSNKHVIVNRVLRGSSAFSLTLFKAM